MGTIETGTDKVTCNECEWEGSVDDMHPKWTRIVGGEQNEDLVCPECGTEDVEHD